MIATEYHRLLLHSEAQKYALAKFEGNEVKYPHQPDYLEDSILERAIKGDRTIGLMLIQDKTGLVKAGCIDIDCPRDAKDLGEGLAITQRLQEIAFKCDLRAYIEFSGNRGYHLWIFVKKPISASLMQLCLKGISSKADFEVKEIFPNAIPETKCIKLPGVIHLKSGARCGFIDETFDPHNPQINLDAQASIMAEFKQNPVEAIANAANQSQPDQSTDKVSNNPNPSVVSAKLKAFGNNHPSCINHLLEKGAPLEIDYNQVNLSIARYCLSKGLSLNDSLPLATAMAKATPDNHSTSKDYQAKISNFKSAFKSASRKGYSFSCSYILAKRNNQPLSSRGCIGDQCSLWQGGEANNKSNSSLIAFNRLIFQSMINLSSNDKEAVKSTILCECESLLKEDSKQKQEGKLFVGEDISEGEKLVEKEAIAYLIQNLECIADYQDIPIEGLKAFREGSLSEYLDELFSLNLPSEDTIADHFERIREIGIKTIASWTLSNYQTKLKTAQSVEVLNNLVDDTERLLKQSLNDKQILPVADHLHSITNSLFLQESSYLPTPSPHLNHILNGGLMPGKLIVIGAPPASGKSTICAWIADYLATLGVKVVYASYEMGREQLVIASLARIGELNSAVIEGKRHLDPNYQAREMLESRLIKAINNYQETIAPHQIIIEADLDYTPARLKAISKKVEANLLIVDYLQLLSSGDQKLDNAYQETLRVSKIATELKRLARDANIPVIAISDINKDSYLKAIAGNDLDMGALRDSFKIAHSADVILLLQSGIITTGKGNEKQRVDQLELLARKYPEKQRLIDRIRVKYPLNKSFADTYSRLSIVKNRGGKLGEPVFKYSRALHTFEPIDFQVEIDIDEQDF